VVDLVSEQLPVLIHTQGQGRVSDGRADLIRGQTRPGDELTHNVLRCDDQRGSASPGRVRDHPHRTGRNVVRTGEFGAPPLESVDGFSRWDDDLSAELRVRTGYDAHPHVTQPQELTDFPPRGHGAVPHAPGPAAALVALPGVHVNQPRQRAPTNDEQVQPRPLRTCDGGGGQPGGDATCGGRCDEGGIPGAGPAQPPGQPRDAGACCGDPSRGEPGGESGVTPCGMYSPASGDQTQGGGPRPDVGPESGAAAAAFHLVGRPGDNLALHRSPSFSQVIGSRRGDGGATVAPPGKRVRTEG